MTMREEIAAQLMDRDEGGGVLEWARKFVAENKDSLHCGDCTKQSHACSRCIADRALRDADRIIEVVRGNGEAHSCECGLTGAGRCPVCLTVPRAVGELIDKEK